MAAFKSWLDGLRKAEQQLEKQLAGIRNAISSLEFGAAASPGTRGRRRGRPVGSPRKRRAMSAKARAAISAAQKKRWAKQKAAEK